MKYLKEYKIFESRDIKLIHKLLGDVTYEIYEDMQVLRDILLEVNDLGGKTYVGITPISFSKIENVIKFQNDPLFKVSDIRMYIQISLPIKYHQNGRVISNIKDIKDKESIEEVIERCIYFLKKNLYETTKSTWVDYGIGKFQIMFSKKKIK